MKINPFAILFWAAVGCVVGALFGVSAGFMTFGAAIVIFSLIGFLL